MIVEIPMNSTNKYEYDSELDLFRLDRALYSPMHYPGDYGFIPGTLAEDGDPMDVLCLVQEQSFTGCVMIVRPVGILNMTDNAMGDQKVLAVPVKNPRYDEIHTIDQIFPHVRREIEVHRVPQPPALLSRCWRPGRKDLCPPADRLRCPPPGRIQPGPR